MLLGSCYVVAKVFLMWLLGHCYVNIRLFLVVARKLLGYTNILCIIAMLQILKG